MIDTVESTLNKKIKNLQYDIAQKFDNFQYSISRLTTAGVEEREIPFPDTAQSEGSARIELFQ